MLNDLLFHTYVLISKSTNMWTKSILYNSDFETIVKVEPISLNTQGRLLYRPKIWDPHLVLKNPYSGL